DGARQSAGRPVAGCGQTVRMSELWLLATGGWSQIAKVRLLRLRALRLRALRLRAMWLRAGRLWLLRRFLLHLLPKGFVRIRHFGFLANRRRATLLPLCLQLLGAVPPSPTEPEASPVQEPSALWLCPKCGGRMVVIERLTAAQLQLRSPPFLVGAAAWIH